MPLDPVLLVETRGWLAKAHSDPRAAEHEFLAAPPLLDDVVFHCQQAAEKAMKGFLTWHGRRFRKTHSLEEIGEQCLQVLDAERSGRSGGPADRICVEISLPWRTRRAGPSGGRGGVRHCT